MLTRTVLHLLLNGHAGVAPPMKIECLLYGVCVGGGALEPLVHATLSRVMSMGE